MHATLKPGDNKQHITYQIFIIHSNVNIVRLDNFCFQVSQNLLYTLHLISIGKFSKFCENRLS